MLAGARCSSAYRWVMVEAAHSAPKAWCASSSGCFIIPDGDGPGAGGLGLGRAPPVGESGRRCSSSAFTAAPISAFCIARALVQCGGDGLSLPMDFLRMPLMALVGGAGLCRAGRILPGSGALLILPLAICSLPPSASERPADGAVGSPVLLAFEGFDENHFAVRPPTGGWPWQPGIAGELSSRGRPAWTGTRSLTLRPGAGGGRPWPSRGLVGAARRARNFAP